MDSAQILLHQFLWKFVPFCNLNGKIRHFCEADPQIKNSKITFFRFCQICSRICLYDQYGYKTCLRHLRVSFRIIYHDIEAIFGFWKSLNFYEKCDFLQFLAFFNMCFKYRFFLQKSLKIGFEAFKSFSELPKHLQMPWITLFDDMKAFWKIMKICQKSTISF